ncbi:MAG: NapC/NirT family cytochrome c [Acidobacteria bacterium]|nr:NapC/NirT family cytochrome c [Acidobacteriota bacterium]
MYLPLRFLLLMLLVRSVEIASGFSCNAGDPLILCRLSGTELDAARRIVDSWDVRHDSPETIRLALKFVDDFPQSPFLHWAYDHAARAAFIIGDARAMDWAILSLRFRPENPALHLLVAQKLESQNSTRQAGDHALEALLQVENLYSRRGSYAMDFPGEADLVVSCAMLLARIAFAGGPPIWNEDQRVQVLARVVRQLVPVLQASRTALSKFQSDMSRDSPSAAQFLLAAIANREVPPKNSAGRVSEAPAKHAIEFRRVVAELGRRPIRTPSFSTYAGSASCGNAGCHVAYDRSWRGSGMSRMSGSSVPLLPKPGSYQVGDLTIALRESPTTIRLQRQGRVPQSYRIVLTIGAIWEQAFATLVAGFPVVLPVQYNRKLEKWETYGFESDETKRARVDEFALHKVSHLIPANAKAFFDECAQCHATRVKRIARPPGGDVLEHGIGCEACHGPSRSHAVQKQKGRRGRTFLPKTKVDFDAICLPCHTHTSVFRRGNAGALNFSGLVFPFAPNVARRSLDEYSEEAFFQDGRLKRATFIGEAVRRTKCFQLGGAGCGKCHRMHQDRNASAGQKEKLLRYEPESDLFCTSCHKDLKTPAQAEKHSLHRANTAGGKAVKCLSCHMPKIMEAPSGQIASHEFDSVPDAVALRVAPSAFSCGLGECHKNRSTAWFDAQLQARKHK